MTAPEEDFLCLWTEAKVTLLPSFNLSAPSTTTTSPSDNPSLMATLSSWVAPRVTSRTVTVLSALTTKNKISLRALLDRGHRYDHSPFVNIDKQMDINELVGEQGIIFIVKNRFELDRTGGVDRSGCQQQVNIPSLFSWFPHDYRPLPSASRLLDICSSTCGRLSSGIANTTVMGCSLVITANPVVSLG